MGGLYSKMRSLLRCLLWLTKAWKHLCACDSLGCKFLLIRRGAANFAAMRTCLYLATVCFLSCCAWFKKENCGTLFIYLLSWQLSPCFLISYCFFPPWCLGVSGIVKQKWLEGILPLLLGKIKGFSDLITKWLWIGQRKVTLAPNWWSQYEASGEPEGCQKNRAYSSSSRAFS